MTLTTDQIRFFHLNGFLAITEPITDDVELAWMREVYDRIFAQKAGRESGDQFDLGGTDEDGKTEALPQILNPAKYAPELKEGKYLGVATQIVRQLLGPEVSASVAHAIFKPAAPVNGYPGAPTPWHQDEAYWDPQWQYKNVSIWMPLQEATLENGCLWFMPGSHEWDVQPHQSINGDARIHGLEMLDTEFAKDAIACQLQPGGITIHRNRTAHYAGPNTSVIPRRALILGAGLPNKPRPGAPRRFPWNEIKETPRDARAKAATKSG